jgi:hypothetical protein
LRTVLVSNGSASPLYNAIAERSEGCVCRPLDHDRDDEIIVVSEERHQPGCEFVDLVQASKALDQIADHLKPAMIVAVEDYDLVLSGCRPEQRTDPDRGLRLQSLGVAYDVVPRRGNQYLLNGDDRVARGFEAAVTALQTDQALAGHLEIRIREFVENRGVDGARKALDSALARRDLVPAAYIHRVRQVLKEERRRLQTLAQVRETAD